MRITLSFVLLVVLGLAASCGPKPLNKQELMNYAGKRYHLKGKVVSIDKRANMANIDGEDIPGFMGAMTMPYVVKPTSELDKLAAGDAITADVVVQGDDSWLENVVVTAHATTTPPK